MYTRGKRKRVDRDTELGYDQERFEEILVEYSCVDKLDW